jgi:hypothetical protein
MCATIQVNVSESGYEVVGWICVTRYTAEWRSVVNTLINQRNYCLAERLLAFHGRPCCVMLVLVYRS